MCPSVSIIHTAIFQIIGYVVLISGLIMIVLGLRKSQEGQILQPKVDIKKASETTEDLTIPESIALGGPLP
jgi:uncharacterized membrane protein